MAAKVSVDDGTDQLLKELVGDFSVSKAVEWLERKFSSFDSSKARPLAVGEAKSEKRTFSQARLLGYVRTLPDKKGGEPNRPVLVAAVAVKGRLEERSSRHAQFSFAKRILKEAVAGDATGLEGYPSQGLFFFYDSDHFFRLSLVSGKVEGRRFKFNEARRQSFFIHPDKPNNTARRRLNAKIVTFADLREAFSVESLTKEFYGHLYEWYEWAMKPRTGVTFPNRLDDNGKDDQDYNAVALIRLITRLMFTWFLKQRDLVPDALFDEAALAGILKRANLTSMDDDNYYRAIVQNLFFATFNCDSRHRVRRFVKIFQGKSDPADEGITTLYRYENEFKDSDAFLKKLMRPIPFLNCALFDCLDNIQKRPEDGGGVFCYDGFSRAKAKQAHVPNKLFFDPERGLIKLFSHYEFTIDENDADDADVALDPELLGKVFENLLGAYNPETKETARNATGSFYTPREIVDYMVEESLKNYLKSKLGGSRSVATVDAWLDDLFDRQKCAEQAELPFGLDVARAISEAIYTCKMLDPACGSGAFPMGMLHCMVRILKRLDPHDTIIRERVQKRYVLEKSAADPTCPPRLQAERRADVEYYFKMGQMYPDYMRKLLIIEDCIYGVDIQPIAIQISKLRFFISLLCDQLRDVRRDENGNIDLLSLPHLESKFVCANTLISLPKMDDELKLSYDALEPKRIELIKNRHEIFRARSVEHKEKLKRTDARIREEIRAAVLDLLTKPDEKKISILKEQVDTLNKRRVAVAAAVWEEKEITEQADLFSPVTKRRVKVDRNAEAREKIDREIAQAERAIQVERDKASPSHVLPSVNYANLVSSWDPYDQNASSPFFDPRWMFNLEDGFDIVIGNPPYGAKLSSADKKYCAENYVSAKTISGIQKGSLDTYSLFIEKEYDILRIGGTSINILPMPIISSDSMTGLHLILFNNCRYIKCSSYAARPQPVFENAMVNTSIVEFIKTQTPSEHIYSTKMYRRGANFDLSDLVGNLEFTDVQGLCLRGRVPKIGSDVERSILSKLLKSGFHPLHDLMKTSGGKVYYRIAGGRYFKVVTNFPTGSTQDKVLYFDKTISNAIGCILSSSLAFWFYQIFSDNLHWKSYEIESFTVPNLDVGSSTALSRIYEKYLADIERNANQRQVAEGSSYHVDSFKEYKIGYSKKIIDEIDDFVGPLYGLTDEEICFIKNYEIEFRMADYMTSDEVDKLKGQFDTTKGSSHRKNIVSKISSLTSSVDDEELE